MHTNEIDVEKGKAMPLIIAEITAYFWVGAEGGRLFFPFLWWDPSSTLPWPTSKSMKIYICPFNLTDHQAYKA